MKLDRNITNPRRGKYALVLMRRFQELDPIQQELFSEAMDSLRSLHAVDFGDSAESDFFVIRLRDKYAGHALTAYGLAAVDDDPEYSGEVLKLAEMAVTHPSKRKPD